MHIVIINIEISRSMEGLNFIDVPKNDGFFSFEAVRENVCSHEPRSAFLCTDTYQKKMMKISCVGNTYYCYGNILRKTLTGNDVSLHTTVITLARIIVYIKSIRQCTFY